MIDGTANSLTARIAIALACLLSAGCACLQPTQPAEPAIAPPVAAVPPAPVGTAASAEVGTRDPRNAEATLATDAATKTPATPVPPVARPARPTTLEPESRAAVQKAPAGATATRNVPPAVAAAPVKPASAMPKTAAVTVSPKPSPAPLDFKGLETRLRQTKAIGVLTKLSLKNQVDDLLARFRAYHQRRGGGTTLAELRRNYDMLMFKVLSLLQDTDPPLARDIVKSRTAMWSILEDPEKFTEFNRMAGATS